MATWRGTLLGELVEPPEDEGSASDYWMVTSFSIEVVYKSIEGYYSTTFSYTGSGYFTSSTAAITIGSKFTG